MWNHCALPSTSSPCTSSITSTIAPLGRLPIGAPAVEGSGRTLSGSAGGTFTRTRGQGSTAGRSAGGGAVVVLSAGGSPASLLLSAGGVVPPLLVGSAVSPVEPTPPSS